MKVKKVLLSVLLMAIAFGLLVNSKSYAENKTLGVEQYRNGLLYRINTVPVFKIVDRSNTSSTAALYCLKAGKGFGSTEGVVADAQYTSSMHMIDNKDSAKSALGLSDANYNSVMWLLDTIYVPGQDSADARKQYIADAFREATNTVSNYFYHWYAVNILQYFTDEDIEVVQQLAIWHFTNSNDSKFNSDTLGTLKVTNSLGVTSDLAETGEMITEFADPVRRGYIRQEASEVLYEYLVKEAKNHTDYTRINSKVTLNGNSANVKIFDNNSLIAGPFEMTSVGTYHDFNGKVTDQSGREISAFTICDENGTTKANRLGDVVDRGQFYLKIAKNVVYNNIEEINIDITYKTDDITEVLWTGGANDQPVVIIDKMPQEKRDHVDVHVPRFDLSLRKYITGVIRDGQRQAIDQLNGRVPNINVSNLVNKTSTRVGITAEYKHRKDPVLVKTGDLVEYTITIYNEGEVDGRATEIIDYLPDGLRYHSPISTDYTFEQTGSKIKITANDNRNLPAFDGTNLASRDIKFICEVTKEESKTDTNNNTLTNIAEISKAKDVYDKDIVVANDDRDSIPDNLSSNLRTPPYNYIGTSGNTVLTDRNYFYMGQEDDDDFEKLIVKTPIFDLSLRKFITHINDEEVSESRAPNYDTTPLKANDINDHTAIYNHKKDPLTVKVGDKVTYTIRVYNEGELDGYPTVIEDYLPEELEMVPKSESQINSRYDWDAQGRVITTQFLNGTVIKAYDGSDHLDSQDVQIECRVKEGAEPGKILTNIAQINGDSGDDIDSQPMNAPKLTGQDLENYKGHEDNKSYLGDKDYYYKGQEDDDDFEKLQIYKSGFDLALRKFITHINDEKVSISREPNYDTTPLKNNGYTAIYSHPKDPLIVKIGDKVTYTIRVYNEGNEDGYPTVIEDYLPEELEMVPYTKGDGSINDTYSWDAQGRVITTTYLDGKVIKAYDGGDDLDYKDVKIECRVKEGAEPGKILTNIAQINGDSGDDRDSVPASLVPPPDRNLPSYEDHEEDDDDYEKIKIYKIPYDLALRKYITEVNGEAPKESRKPVVDVSPLMDESKDKKTAIYTHTKEPLLVKNGDIVTYTIRVYNEGEVNAYVEEIKDNIPEGLEFLIDNETNIEYRWKLSADEKQVSTDYLSRARDEKNVIPYFKADYEIPDDDNELEKVDGLYSRYVKIAFKVVEPNTSTRIITNIAEIKNDDGDDDDSTPDNDVPNEDDIDVEHIKLRYFDLALRKFITKVESKSGENLPIETDTTTNASREPQVEIDEEGKIKYVHPKDPVVIANSDVVIYTLRVYNEGTIDGYAEEIKDDVPAGLELLPSHEINVKYDWKMYDESGNETDDPQKAKTIRTTYLSEEKDENNIIRAFNRETMSTPDHKEVQVAFKVVEKNANSDRIIINTAEISKDSDDDTDSTPDNNAPDEDDIDKEYIKLKYFDLSLLKWVSKVIITENGETKVTETGYNGLENPEPIVKLELKPNQIKSIVLKYEYGIKITNEGQIPGYAKEITDYIPNGLAFVPEDNPLWTVKEDGKIVTTQLENTLLQPGESAIVTVVFRWINGNDNFGTKENWAEISKDYNDKEAPDIDSTPNNQVRGEDDIDNALVVLNPKTGQGVVYVVLPTMILTILSTGIIFIKKYVL